MFRIRKEQRAAFVAAAREDFEERMLAHLRRFFAHRLGEVGDARALVRYGIERAATYGVVSERDVCRYIDVMVVFGRDADVEQPWAAEVLNDRALVDPSARIRKLHAAAVARAKEGVLP